MIRADVPGGGQHFAGRADIDVPFSVVPKVIPRKGPILALRFVDDRNVRRDVLLIDYPIERFRRAISRITGEIGGLDIKTLLRPFDHCLSCTDLWRMARVALTSMMIPNLTSMR